MADRERITRWFSVLCAIPWLVTSGAYLELCVARLVLARWPRPMLDDPKQLATAPLHCVLVVLLLSLGGTIPLLVVLAVWNRRKVLSDWRYSLRIGVFAVGLLTFWILTHYDAGHVWEWFFD